MDAYDENENGPQRPRSPTAVPLESHDVIELQAFNQKTDWILERTRLLEDLPPPTDVFIGEYELGELRRTPGLPSLEQFAAWRAEYDRIEGEAEQFDREDMKRLRDLAEVAGARSLTPEDTDLIEITLNTLVLVSDLLELLQKRGRKLDILECRLRWEDERLEARQERLSILADLHAFITSSARWSPAMYKDMKKSELGSSLGRKLSDDSSVSLHSSLSSSTSPSRNLRQRTYDALCTDAAQITNRIATLRHVKVDAAAKSLDRFIETSSEPLPDAFLDEQDRIENESEAMDGLGKFALAVTSQWKRADHDYNQFLRDTAEAQTVLDDLEKAVKEPPNQQLDGGFTSRTATLINKLARYSDPLVSKSFPRPVHHAFPDQSAANDRVAGGLSVELTTAKNLARLAAARSKEYHESLLTVRRAEHMKEEMTTLQLKLVSVRRRLTQGVDVANPRSSAPDLSNTSCLNVGQHQSYMDTVPSLLEEVDQLLVTAEKSVRGGRTLAVELKRIPLDEGFLATFNETLSSLGSDSGLAAQARVSASTLSSRFKTVCGIWSFGKEVQRLARSCGAEICEGLERDRWKPQPGKPNDPLTPDTPSKKTFSIPPSLSEARRKLEDLSTQIYRRMQAPTKPLSPHLGEPLRTHLDKTTGTLQEEVGRLQDLVKLWGRVQEQALAMTASMMEAEGLEQRLSSLADDIEAVWHGIVTASAIPDLCATEVSLKTRLDELRSDVLSFKDSLPRCIPLVASSNESSLAPTTFIAPSPRPHSPMTKPYTPPETGLESARSGVPFDPRALDNAVRSHVNVKAANLTGALHNVEKRMIHISVAGRIGHLDISVEDAERAMGKVSEEMQAKEAQFLLMPDASQADLAIADAQRCLERLNSEVASVSAYIDGLDARFAKILSPPQSLNSDIAKSLDYDDDEIKSVLLNPRDERLQRLVSIQDVIRADATAALQRLEGAKVAGSAILASLEKAESERLAAKKRAREEAEAEALRQAELEIERCRAEREAEERSRTEAEELARREAEEQEQRAAKQRRLQEDESLRQEEQAAAGTAMDVVTEETPSTVPENSEPPRNQEDAGAAGMAEAEPSPAPQEVVYAQAVVKGREPKLLEDSVDRDNQGQGLVVIQPLSISEIAPVPVEEAIVEHTVVSKPPARPSVEDVPLGTLAPGSIVRDQTEGDRSFGAGPPGDKDFPTRAVNEDQEPIGVSKEVIKAPATLANRPQDLDQDYSPVLTPQLFSEEDADAYQSLFVPEDELKVEHLRIRAPTKDAAVGREPPHRYHGDDAEVDVFGLNIPIGPSKRVVSYTPVHEITALLNSLLSLNLQEGAFPTSEDAEVEPLPVAEEIQRALTELGNIQTQMELVHVNPADTACLSGFKNLEAELHTMKDLIPRLESLANFSTQATVCDVALSHLINHCDAYPDFPTLRSADFQPGDSAREQLSRCLDDASSALLALEDRAAALNADPRVKSERERLNQMWEEAREMVNDRLDPSFVRAPSSMSISSMNSSISLHELHQIPSTRPSLSRQSSSTFVSGRSSVLSASTNSIPYSARRTAPSQASTSSRSVSGPTPRTPANRSSSAAQAPTAASTARQRTASGASARRVRESLDKFAPPSARGLNEVRSRKTSMELSPVRPRNLSLGAWDKTPRHSLGSPGPTPKTRVKKRAYVANPKNKLDMAVGDVVNKLHVNVKVEAIQGWKDQSGRYWIGDKTYFCRILRSQTVMVRVGGGWTELSKFIKSHFADLFRVLPPGLITSPTPGRSEEPWISAASIRAKGSPLLAGGSPAATFSSLPGNASPTFLEPWSPGPAIHVEGSPFSVTSSWIPAGAHPVHEARGR